MTFRSVHNMPWVPGETKKQFLYKKNFFFNFFFSLPLPLYSYQNANISIFELTHKLMFVKTQTKWALMRVNYVVLVFGTKKNVLNPIIE